jgi:imidazolonepropionase-like amidohydrolase
MGAVGTDATLPARLAAHRLLFTGAALADGRRPTPDLDVSLLVEDGTVAGLWADGHRPDVAHAEVIDASGCTIVPALVDSHAHLVMQGGANWAERGTDATSTLLAVAEENAALMLRSGVRWARDLGAPTRVDPYDGRRRALSIGLRERWKADRRYPYIRAAGTWVTRAGTLPSSLGVEVNDGDGLVAAALGQLDDGADLVKLYLDGPGYRTAAFEGWEVRRVVDAVHERGARVAAHATVLDAARAAADAGVDSLEHGFEIDEDVAAALVANRVTLVSTLAMLQSVLSFERTTALARFRRDSTRAWVRGMLESAQESVRLAHRRGVAIAAGTDFGGGSTRANHLPWEVELLVRAGLEPWEALGAVTWRGGKLLGEPSAGTIEVGGRAHFALVHGDPLSDPAALWRVWMAL